jgi:hypothetical protein
MDVVCVNCLRGFVREESDLLQLRTTRYPATITLIPPRCMHLSVRVATYWHRYSIP